MTTAPTPAPPRPRPEIVCPDSGPEPPYPLRMEGKVISGFGRGSKQLGIPTANLPVDATATPWIGDIKSGVYFGYASLALPSAHPDYAAPPSSHPATASSSAPQPPSSTSSPASWHVYPMVMSIGYNPFYGNRARSAEVHVLHGFAADFYGADLRLLILGFVREERGDYAGLEDLVADIRFDCAVARRSLARPAWTPRPGVTVLRGGAADGDGKEGEGDGQGTGTLDAGWLVREG
ncbi:hypothetical protein DL766_006608 [Monosporascus sp. MC13-8B]|uniref:Riboflavin kinase n=1 Tax=Monosporascus cannonballus TaxID=155416 RepID=A0ABY0HEV3_9PEZI|nr:hypothetical protein DL762_001931 [Monosporascus cannonballus]RYO91977.1 hypothetical protein DL763_004821 [Monosporascus cannonballus]RYP26802.1 hypothetical protein DL766_006608 [Monosporascus sp. MC13-8B]